MQQRLNIPVPESMSHKQDDDNQSSCQSSQGSRHSRISMLQEKRAETTRFEKDDGKDLRASGRSTFSRQSAGGGYRQSVALQQIQ